MTSTNYTSHKPTDLSDLPQELYHEITSHLPGDLSTLSALCTTSRQLCHAAQPVLFRDFSSRNLKTHLQFMHTIIGNDILAGYVREYKLVTQEIYQPMTWALLAKGMGRMRNLTRLAVRNYSKVRLDTSKFLGFCFPPPGPGNKNDPEGRYNYTTGLIAFSWFNAYHFDDDKAVFQFLKRAKGLKELDLECRGTALATTSSPNICSNLVSIRGNFHFINMILPKRPHIREIQWVSTKSYLLREKRVDEEALLIGKEGKQMYANVKAFKLCNRQGSVARPRKMAFDKVVSELVGVKILHIEILRMEDLEAILATKPPLPLETLIIDKLYESRNPRFNDARDIVKRLFAHLGSLRKVYIRGYQAFPPMSKTNRLSGPTLAAASRNNNPASLYANNVGVLYNPQFPPPVLGLGPLTFGSGEYLNMENMSLSDIEALGILKTQIVMESTSISRAAPVLVPAPTSPSAPGIHLAVPPLTHHTGRAAMPPLIDIGSNINGSVNGNVVGPPGLPIAIPSSTPPTPPTNKNVINLNSSTIAELKDLFPVPPMSSTIAPTMLSRSLHGQPSPNEHLARTSPCQTGSRRSPITSDAGIGASTSTPNPTSPSAASNTGGLGLNTEMKTEELDVPAIASSTPTSSPEPGGMHKIVNIVAPNLTRAWASPHVHHPRVYIRGAGYGKQQEGITDTTTPTAVNECRGVQECAPVSNVPAVQQVLFVQVQVQSTPAQSQQPFVPTQPLPFVSPKKTESEHEVEKNPESASMTNLQSSPNEELKELRIIVFKKELLNEKSAQMIDGLLFMFAISVMAYVGYQLWTRAAPFIFGVALVAFCVDTWREHGTIFGMACFAGCLLGCLMIVWGNEGFIVGSWNRMYEEVWRSVEILQ